MTTYTWKIERLDAYPSYEGVSNAVYNMHWRLLAEDGLGHRAECYGTQAAGPIDAEDFTAYEDLTKAQVIGWLEAAMGQGMIDELKAGLDGQISKLANPTTAMLAVPWE